MKNLYIIFVFLWIIGSPIISASLINFSNTIQRPGGLIAHYFLDDNLFTTPIIDSRQIHHGWLNFNTTSRSVPGRINNAINFSTSEIIIIPAHTDFNTRQLTISFWLNTSAPFISIARKWESLNDQRSWRIFTNASGDLLFQVSWDGRLTNLTSLNSTFFSHNNQWNHYIFDFNRTHLRLFINGQLINSIPTPHHTIFHSTSNINIGQRLVTGTNLIGRLDDFRIYDRVLTPTEINLISSLGTQEHLDSLYRQEFITLNMTILNSNGSVGVEFDGINFTATNISNEFEVRIPHMRAGNYSFYWWGFERETNISRRTLTRIYQVQRGFLFANLTSSLGWVINESQIVTIGFNENNLGDQDVVYNVFRDNILKGESETWDALRGNWIYILNTTGGENYTASQILDIRQLIVQEGVFDNIIPFWNNLRNFTSFINHSFSEFITATDNINISSYWLNQTDVFNIDVFTGRIFNITHLILPMRYNLLIFVNDTSNNILQGEFNIEILEYQERISQCGRNVSILRTRQLNERVYGKLCHWLNFR